MVHAIEVLTAAGRDDITLWVLEDNDQARRFYEALGFKPDGTRKIRDYGAPVATVRYRRPAAGQR
jgi:ribosomal protein S18 acetylase RimI-like enzyme